VPPKRCPECGRFLANDLVSSLADAPAPCPRCGIELHPDTIVGGERPRRLRSARPAAATVTGTDAAAGPAPEEPATPPGAAAPAATETVAASSSAGASDADADSIRPPDLDPQAVRTPDEDVLAGWDVGASAVEVASWQRDERPFPTDTVVVVGAAVAGGLLGALLADRHRGRWAVLGALGGAAGAGVARRIWELRG
jgi:hypothetical protein